MYSIYKTNTILNQMTIQMRITYIVIDWPIKMKRRLNEEQKNPLLSVHKYQVSANV